MSGFVIHPEAYADLDEIWEYIAKARSHLPAAAFSDGARLSVGLRLVYDPDARPLRVIAVVRARRSPRVMAAILRGRE